MKSKADDVGWSIGFWMAVSLKNIMSRIVIPNEIELIKPNYKVDTY